MVALDVPGVRSGVAARAYPGEDVNGDGWLLAAAEQRIWVAVADGLGHGPSAAHASTAAMDALRGSPGVDPLQALARCHTALRGTRGAAVSVAVVDTGARTLTYAGVGNVDARLWRPDKTARLISYRGIVGSAYPTVRAFTEPLGNSWALVMHSDGVSARFDLEQVPEFADHAAGPQALADAVLAGWGRTTDDATVVVLDGRT